MPKANFNRLFFISLSLTLFGLIGCSGPEEKKASSLEKVADLRADGQNEEALSVLEELAADHPNDPAILRQIGTIFSEENDTTMAAFFIEQAHEQNPDDIELLFQTYTALEAANQPTNQLLERMATKAPNSMSDELWIKLGKSRAKDNKTQLALDAYLKGVNPEKSTPPANIAASIGSLFMQLENSAQAERWFELAVDNDSPDALTALFGLLEIKLSQKDWKGSEGVITRLDKQFPGAVDASEWASARSELKRWREAQSAMKAELAKAEAAKKAAEASAAKAKAEAEKATVVATSDDTTSEKTDTEGKAQVIADLEAAESMANTPAVEVVSADTTVESVEETTIAFNPSIVIEPAEPDVTFGVTYDQQDNSVSTSYVVDNTVDVAPVETTLEETIDPITVRPAGKPLSIDELIQAADQATTDRNYKLAISSYWQVLGSANDRDDIWNLLSRAYLIDGQFKNAETTALEAIRIAPREIKYTLAYLRVAQRSKTPSGFLTELKTAHDRFPRSPEVTLSLARGYERIAEDAVAAASLYRQFIELAPSHPLRPEAETAIDRLQ